jgi:hypothetical protein
MCCLTNGLLAIKYKSDIDKFTEKYDWIKCRENIHWKEKEKKCKNVFVWRCVVSMGWTVPYPKMKNQKELLYK